MCLSVLFSLSCLVDCGSGQSRVLKLKRELLDRVDADKLEAEHAQLHLLHALAFLATQSYNFHFEPICYTNITEWA